MKKAGLYTEILPDEISLFGDVPIEMFDDEGGRPIRISNPEIRRMIRLAKPNKMDIFYDLGCGFGQTLIIAASEFGLARCVGIESNEIRFKIARRRVEKWIRAKRVSKEQILLKNDTIERFIDRKVSGASPRKATIIYYGLNPFVAHEFNRKGGIEREYPLVSLDRCGLKEGCKVITHFTNGIFAGVKPVDVDYPFYLYEYPFENHSSKSELVWLRSVIRRENGTKRIGVAELWDELAHDYGVESHSREEILDKLDSYKEHLKTTRWPGSR